MSESTSESPGEPDPEVNDVAGTSDESAADTVSVDDYALGRTSDPDGAEREEPAGEDYAGSGF